MVATITKSICLKGPLRGPLLASFLILFSADGGAATPPALATLVVGTVFPLSGAQAPFGREATRGIELAIEELKTRDPALAARITVVAADDQSQSTLAAQEALRLVDKERVNLVIGSFGSASSSAIAEVLKPRGIPYLAPLAAQSSLSAGDGTYRTDLSEALEGAILARFALETLDTKSAGTIYDDSLPAQGFESAFVSAFQAGGGTLLGREKFPVGSDEFGPPLKRLAEAGAKVIVTPSAWPAAAKLVKKARQLNLKVRFLGGDSWDTTSFNQAIGGREAVGHFFVAHFAADDTSATAQKFVGAFKAKFGRAPGSVAALAYDTMQLAAAAFTKANATLKGLLNAELSRTKEFPGATGEISLSDGPRWAKSGIVKETTLKASNFRARVASESPAATPVPLAAPFDQRSALMRMPPSDQSGRDAKAPAPRDAEK